MKDTPGKSIEEPTVGTPKAPGRRRHRAAKFQPLTRGALDGRTNAARGFERLVGAIHSDLGGLAQLSAIQVALVEAFAGVAVHLNGLNTRLLLGEEVDLSDHASAISSLVRIATRLGTERRSRDVTPSIEDYLKQKNEQDVVSEASE